MLVNLNLRHNAALDSLFLTLHLLNSGELFIEKSGFVV